MAETEILRQIVHVIYRGINLLMCLAIKLWFGRNFLRDYQFVARSIKVCYSFEMSNYCQRRKE
jgi:hypothetical protein